MARRRALDGPAARPGGPAEVRCVLPGDGPLPGAARRHRREGAGVDDHRVHPAAAQPAARPRHRPARRADHPRRGAHLRHRRAVPRVQDLRAVRPALRAGRRRAAALLPGGDRRPDPRGGHHRGRLDGVVHRGGHGVRHVGRADDPVLHLLFDVRVPAGRRPDLGASATCGAAASCSARPPGAPRCRARAPALRRPQPRVGGRPSRTAAPTTPRSRTRWRSSSATASRRMYGAEPEDCFYYLTLYNENYPMPPMPDGVEDGIVRGLYRYRPARRRARPPGADPRQRHRDAGRARSAAAARRRVRRRRRRVERDELQAAARRRARPSSGGTGCTPPRRPGVPYVTERSARPRARSSPSPTS